MKVIASRRAHSSAQCRTGEAACLVVAVGQERTGCLAVELVGGGEQPAGMVVRVAVGLKVCTCIGKPRHIVTAASYTADGTCERTAVEGIGDALRIHAATDIGLYGLAHTVVRVI